MFFMYFPWPPLEAGLSVSTFCFLELFHQLFNSVTDILLMNKENCALKLVEEIILYSDVRSKKHQRSISCLFKLGWKLLFVIYPLLMICSSTKEIAQHQALVSAVFNVFF